MAGALLPGLTVTVDETIATFCDAWNRHAAAELAAMWTEDGELNHPWGFRRVGRDAILELLREEHAGSMAGATLDVQQVVSRGDESSVSTEIQGVLKGVRAPNGRTYELPHSISALFVRAGDQWRIRTMTPRGNS